MCSYCVDILFNYFLLYYVILVIIIVVCSFDKYNVKGENVGNIV